jgi:hypothetical protein
LLLVWPLFRSADAGAHVTRYSTVISVQDRIGLRDSAETVDKQIRASSRHAFVMIDKVPCFRSPQARKILSRMD